MTHSSARTTSRLSSYCDGLNRREMLSVGSLGGLGLGPLLLHRHQRYLEQLLVFLQPQEYH